MMELRTCRRTANELTLTRWDMNVAKQRLLVKQEYFYSSLPSSYLLS